MDSKIKDITQSTLLLMAFQLLIKSGVCPKTNPSEWLRLLLYLHVKGWLFVHFEDEKLAVVVAAYRIPEGWDIDILPEKEEGDILYVPFLASFAKDPLLPKKMLGKYLKKNPEVKRILFFERNSDEDKKEFKIPNVEDKNVEVENAESTGNADVPGRPEVSAGDQSIAGVGEPAHQL